MSWFSRLFGKQEKPNTAAFEMLINQCMAELQLKTQAHDSMWQISEAAWDVDQDNGKIIFTSPTGMIATCPVQIIGTRNQDEGTFLWSWGNPSISEELQQHALTVRQFGVENNFGWLITPMIRCPEEKAWNLAALACKMNDAQGAYRGEAGPTAIYMTFGDVELTQPPTP